MPAISNIHNFEPAVKRITNIGSKPAAKSSQAKKLTDKAITWNELRNMISAQNLEVTNGISKAEKDAPLDMLSRTLYIVCWS